MAFESRVVTADPSQYKTPLLAVLVPRGDLPASLAALDKATSGALGRAYESGDFTGKRDDTLLAYADAPFARVLLIGVGKSEESSAARRCAVRRRRPRSGRGCSVPAPRRFYVAPEALGKVSARQAAQAVAEGLAQGAWHFTELKRPPEEPKAPLERVDVLAPADAAGLGRRAIAVGAAIGAGQTLARGLQMLPGNQLHARRALAGRGAGHRPSVTAFAVTVLDQAAIVKEKMGALLAVAQGSVEEPRFIVLEYQGAAGRAGGAGRQGRHVRHRRHLDQAGAEHGGHEVRHVGRGRGARHLRDAGPAQAQGARGRADPVHREHAVGHGGQAGRRGHEPPRARPSRSSTPTPRGGSSCATRCPTPGGYKPACVIDIATLTGAIVVALGHTATGAHGHRRAR